MGIHRSATARRRRQEQQDTRLYNARYKTKERDRRDAKMAARVKSGSLPYAPEVMSWLSAKLDKQASRITAEDVAKLG